jgi:hypothetical protein
MDILFNIKGAIKGKAVVLRKFIDKFRDRIFCKHIQIPSRLSFVTEHTNAATYMDPVSIKALNAISTITHEKSSISELTLKQKESMTVKALIQMDEYHQEVIKENLAKKKGWFRKHGFGSRMHYSFRAVISSRTDNHAHDELLLPWGLMVNLLNVHITSKLLKLGRTPSEAHRMIIQSLNTYDPFIHQILQELIDEGPEGSLHVLFQRNPSLRRNSIQLFRVCRVKTDVNDQTVSISVNAITGKNADFDGDSLNGCLILDIKMLNAVRRLAPSFSVMSLDDPLRVCDTVKLASPVVSTTDNFIERGACYEHLRAEVELMNAA